MRVVLLLAWLGVIAAGVVLLLAWHGVIAVAHPAADPVVMAHPAADPVVMAHPAADPVVIDPVPGAPAFLSAIGDEAVGPDAEGLLIASVTIGMPAAAAGVLPGDRLLAIDGLRIHSGAEFNMIKTLPKPGHEAEHWSLRRGRVVVETDLVGLRANGLYGVNWQSEPPKVAQAFLDAGVHLDPALAEELDHLPARLGHAVAAWHRGHVGMPAPVWLGHVAGDWHAMLHGEALIGNPDEMPVRILAEVERFWHALAKDKPDEAPSPARWGCDAAFAALFYPYAPLKNLDFGKPVIADASLLAQVEKLYQLNAQTSPDLQVAAVALADRGYRGGVTDADRFIGQCAAALLDDANQGGWPFRSTLIWKQEDRITMIAALQARLEAGDGDADLLRYALIGPLAIEHQDDEVRTLISTIAGHSRFLGMKALDTAQMTIGMWRHGSTVDKEAYAEAYAGALGIAEGPHGIIYPWVMARSSKIAGMVGSDQLWRARFDSVPNAFRGCPGLVAAALAPDAPVVEANEATMATVIWQCQGLMWKLATDGTMADGAQAMLLADMMATSGVTLTENHRDAIAVGCARNGDFAQAAIWEHGAVVRCDNSVYCEDYLSRLGHFTRHEPVALNDRPRGTTVSEPSADGTMTCKGQRAADGKAVGPWRFVHADGSVVASGGYNADGLPEGVWRSFGADGKPRIEAGFVNGRRFGRFRAWNDAGNLMVEGWYHQGDGNIPLRFGLWTWYNSDGTRHEAGRFMDDLRAGTWTIWNPAGEVTASAQFTDDHADGPWPEETPPAMPPYMPPVAPEAPSKPGAPADKY